MTATPPGIAMVIVRFRCGGLQWPRSPCRPSIRTVTPTTPSRRRVRGDGSDGGPAGAGAIAAGFPAMQLTYPKERRCKMQENSRRKKKNTARTGRTENTPRGEGKATRPKRKQGTEPETQYPKTTEETPKSPGKKTEGTLRNVFQMRKPSACMSVATNHKGITKPPAHLAPQRFGNST